MLSKSLVSKIAVILGAAIALPHATEANSGVQERIASHCPIGDTGCPVDPDHYCEIHLGLGDAIERALTLNRSLRLKRNSTCKAQIDLAQERTDFEFQLEPSVEAGFVAGGTAGTGPSLAGAIDFTKKFTTGTSVKVKPEANRAASDYWYANLVTEIRQPLLRGYGRLYNLDKVQRKAFDFRTSQRNLYKSRVSLVVETVKALYEIVKQRDEMELLGVSLELLNGFFHAAQVKDKLGIHDAIGVYRAELEIRSVEDALAEAVKRHGDAEDKLRDLLVLPMHTRLNIDVPLVPEAVDLESDLAVQTGLCHRIELDQARDHVWETVRRSKVKRLELLPQLDLVLNYSRCGQNQIFTKACWGDNESEFGVGIQASTKVNRHKDRLEVDKSLLDVHCARIKYSQEVDAITVDVRRKLRALERQAERIELAFGAAQTAERDLELAAAKYERNLANNKDVIDAERALRLARSAYTQAMVSHIVGEYELLKSLGILLEKPCI